jgi:uncharacterized membrane protein YtjA (UPF0391 family)
MVMAIACFGFFTLLPGRPLLSSPCLYSRMTLPTFRRRREVAIGSSPHGCISRAATTPCALRSPGNVRASGSVARDASAMVARPRMTETCMLYWAVVFLIIAIIAGIFGFGGIAAASAGIAKILFFIFIAVFLVTLIMGFARRV